MLGGGHWRAAFLRSSVRVFAVVLMSGVCFQRGAMAATEVAMAAVPLSDSGLDYPSIWQCDVDKFHWYCDVAETTSRSSTPKLPALPRTLPLELPPKLPAHLQPPQPPIETAQQLREALRRLEDVAIMDPSTTNLKRYLSLWQFSQQKAAVFADNWRRVVWQNPELDYSLKRASNNSAVKLENAQREDEEATQLRRLAKTHGLIFFFRSDCPYCHAMAPTVLALERAYGIEVLGVTLDGGVIPGFHAPVDGRAQAGRWDVQRVPAVFIGAREGGGVAPVGFGIMARAEIVNRLFVLTATTGGERL